MLTFRDMPPSKNLLKQVFLFALKSFIIKLMSFSLVYLVHRFFYRIYDFLRHWYVGGFLAIARRTLAILERLDRTFALRITLRYFLKPLYQDYSILGYVLGFFFRTGRLLAGGVVYLAVVAIAAAVYLFWAGLPFYIVAKGFLKI